jgi:hypothetical protein
MTADVFWPEEGDLSEAHREAIDGLIDRLCEEVELRNRACRRSLSSALRGAYEPTLCLSVLIQSDR